ncbi:MAG: hypothetical protein AVDCRST_MAG85-449 [uncultured Solirubrobacteraceae bacterium]|uniref:Integral membrane protein n=1 Tax=uncultured Solirubrobacteraceae bacterium TaxID=1162706 RepID=A0A6J4RWN4_9ACTN|nr:MAG: hypothetical protein AVDCRST_MAG85-449 [uncultured Solirubrobacteraceae bacterium]
MTPLKLSRAQRRQLRVDRRTWALGVAALGTTGVVLFGELARVWTKGSAPLPTEIAEPVEIVQAADEAVRETVEVAVAGYQGGSTRENALFNLLGSFSMTFGLTRLTTFIIRRYGRVGPLRNYRWGGRHIHHFVPGIAIAFLAGGASVISRNQELDPWLALPFGFGVALTLDESALLLELDDVYWTERGIVSVQITLGALALLSSAALGLRLLRRGEREVLDEEELPPMDAAAWTTA